MKTQYICETCNHIHEYKEDIDECTECDKEICTFCCSQEELKEMDDAGLNFNEYLARCPKCHEDYKIKYSKVCLECERPFSKFGGPNVYSGSNFCNECYEYVSS